MQEEKVKRNETNRKAREEQAKKKKKNVPQLNYSNPNYARAGGPLPTALQFLHYPLEVWNSHHIHVHQPEPNLWHHK